MSLHRTLATALILLGVVALGACNGDKPLEYQLAVIEAGGHVPEDHLTVARFRSLLGQLSDKYGETAQQIADATVKGRELLSNDGLSEQMLRMMEGMNGLFSSRQPSVSYTEFLAAYITLRIKGQSHGNAVSGLRGILSGLGVR